MRTFDLLSRPNRCIVSADPAQLRTGPLVLSFGDGSSVQIEELSRSAPTKLLEEECMKTWMTVVTAISLLLSSCPSRADFKYTENTKITGGAVAGLMKFASRVSGKAGVPESS